MNRIFMAAAAALTLLGTSANAMSAETIDPSSMRAEFVSAETLSFSTGAEEFNLFEDFEVEDFTIGQQLVGKNARPKARPDNFAQDVILGQLPTTLKGASDFMCLAVAIYHEARGETSDGQAAVASVILQRAAVPGRWGDTACEVVVPVQFSFLDADSNFDKIDEFDAWIKAVDVATVAIVQGPDPWLANADHYHTKAVNPSWNDAMPVVARIGEHIFYADPISIRRLRLAGLNS